MAKLTMSSDRLEISFLGKLFMNSSNSKMKISTFKGGCIFRIDSSVDSALRYFKGQCRYFEQGMTRTQ